MATTRARSRRSATAAVCILLGLLARDSAHACTAFCAVGKDGVYVGNNEDYNNPRTRLWFVPATPGSFGRMYVGFDDLTPQGGMNERGLWFDGFAAPPQKVSSTLPHFQGNIVDRAMAECETVEDVVELFSRYNRNFLSEGILMFADASGDAVSIEANAIVRKSRRHFVQTNVHQSQPEKAAGDRRFQTATSMLEQADGGVSLDLSRRILASTAQKGPFPTLYSNVYELRSRTMHLYYFRDFDRAVTFKLDDELRKGAHVLEIPSLFPRSAAADAFAARLRVPGGDGQTRNWIATLAGLTVLMLVVLVALVRGGRRVRIACAAVAGIIVGAVALVALAVNLHPNASPGWVAFSIGAASGRNSRVGPNLLRSEGMSLRAAIATAYDVPAVRVVAPQWMDQARYTINAVGSEQVSGTFRPMLQQELSSRLHMTTHREVRPFEVFVLTASASPRLTRVDGTNVRVWVHDSGMELQEAAMTNLAAALQGVLGKPVIDDTRLDGRFELELDWTEDRVGSLSTALRERFGLELTPAKRNLEVLVVDSARRDPALFMLDHLGRLTAVAPPHIRARLANLLSVD